MVFQSPRSGQICSNSVMSQLRDYSISFQSPRSGQICSNFDVEVKDVSSTNIVSIP